MAYGFAHLGKSLFWYASELLFAYFLTELAGLSIHHMGIVLATGFLVSAAVDLIVGRWLERRLTTAASASRIQLVGAVLCSASLIAVFVGAWMPVELRFGYALAAGIAFRLGYAAYDIPQNALMALATADAHGRLRVASTRIWFSGMATLIVAAAIGPLIASRDQPEAVVFLVGLTVLFATVAIGSAWLLAQLLHGQEPALPEAGAALARGHPSVDFWLLLLVMVATSVFTPVFGKLEPYFATYTLRSAWWGGVVIILTAAGIVAGQPIWLHLCARVSGGVVMLFNALLQIAALTAFWLIGSAFPAASAAAAFLFGLGNGGVGMVQWAAFSETVARLGPGRMGLSYGLFAAVGKLSLAVGSLLLAAALTRIDFRGPDGTDLVFLMAAIPGTGALCCGLVGIGLFVVESAGRRLASPMRGGFSGPS
ncbi:MFS transporter [Novosphingobium sp. H3SJ31-1]|uniref:MFS transporter n=1 Tax=Novosphingobium album (ex Liu et al. 2023) TaxID=3031130 RepID=A0ABT5WKZ6_9SPHN|nr:MFS transporter [Novosphingobium album (ex Liu et al. 2023)]MDE8650701.1 MFS transporter [Novosphingobium album (ex Liu et al. 2023)]